MRPQSCRSFRCTRAWMARSSTEHRPGCLRLAVGRPRRRPRRGSGRRDRAGRRRPLAHPACRRQRARLVDPSERGSLSIQFDCALFGQSQGGGRRRRRPPRSRLLGLRRNRLHEPQQSARGAAHDDLLGVGWPADLPGRGSGRFAPGRPRCRREGRPRDMERRRLPGPLPGHGHDPAPSAPDDSRVGLGFPARPCSARSSSNLRPSGRSSATWTEMDWASDRRRGLSRRKPRSDGEGACVHRGLVRRDRHSPAPSDCVSLRNTRRRDWLSELDGARVELGRFGSPSMAEAHLVLTATDVPLHSTAVLFGGPVRQVPSRSAPGSSS